MEKQSTHTGHISLYAHLIRFIHLIEDSLIVLILATMVILAGGQIVLRNFLDFGLSWGDPLLRLSVLWVGLLGAMAASREENHISIDALYRILPTKTKHISRLITDLFTASICTIVAYHATRLVILEKEDGIIAFANIPSWVCELIIPFGFGVMALRFLLSFLLNLFGKTEASANDQSGNTT